MAAVILHCFDPVGWEEWGLSRRPLIRSGMPVLVDDDLKFEDESGERPTVVMNRWLRELPVSGAPAPKTWLTYAQVLKAWSEFLAERGVGVFADRTRLRAVLSMYAEHRLSGAVRGRWGGASWNLALNTLSGFYRWAQEAGYVAEVPFSYARHCFTRPDGMLVESSRNLAAVRTARPHARRKYLERPYVELLLHALAGNDAAGEPDTSFRGRESGRNHALVGLALGSQRISPKKWRAIGSACRAGPAPSSEAQIDYGRLGMWRDPAVSRGRGVGVRDRAGVFAALVRAPGDPDGSGRVLLPHDSYTVTDKNLQAELEGARLIVSEPESGGISRHNAGETCLMPDYRT
jgi:hypothetical protein